MVDLLVGLMVVSRVQKLVDGWVACSVEWMAMKMVVKSAYC